MKFKIFIGLLIFFLGIQFIPIERKIIQCSPKQDFLEITKANSEIKSIIKRSCYDCHSYQTKYPWYTYVAPFSFVSINHIKEGRNSLNFSTWSHYDSYDKQRKIEESIKSIKENAMPLMSYKLFQFNSQLSKSDQEKLISFLKSNIK